MINLSTVLRYTGREEGLKEIYETLLHINSKDLTAIYELAHYFDNAGNFEEAEEYYGKSLEIDPEYFPALINIAQLLCDRERFAESEAFFHRAVKVDPSDPEVWFKFGFCLMEKGNYSEGYKAYLRAHQLQPEYFFYSKALNLAEKQLRGEIDWATISKIMKKPLEPPNGIVRISSMYDKKVIQVEGKDIGPFFDILEDISLISPLNVYILPNANVLRVPQPEIQKVIDFIAAGINEVKSMNLQKAETVFREIFAQYPDIKGTRHNLVVNLMQQGKLDEAHEILRPLADNNNLNVTEKILLGHLMHEKGLHNAAEKIYADALLNTHTIDKYGAINLNFYYNEQEKY